MLETFPQAISVSEGFPVLGSRPRLNNNPGDLIWGPEAERLGAIRGDKGGYPKYSGFAVFPTPAIGWKALVGWLSVPATFHQGPLAGYFTDPNGTTLVGGYLGATIAQVIYRFAPPSDNNNTEKYITGVCERTGLTRETVVTAELLLTPEVSL